MVRKGKRKKIIIANGYRFTYMPKHPRAKKSFILRGYIQEHIAVMEASIGRSLRENEIVHHLDLNKANNKISNLLLIESSQHNKIHSWIDAGAPGVKNYRRHTKKIGTTRQAPKYCKYKECGTTLQGGQKEYCCLAHATRDSRHPNRPKDYILKRNVSKFSISALSRKYDVTRTAIHHWCQLAGIQLPKRHFGGKQEQGPALLSTKLIIETTDNTDNKEK